MARRLRAAEPSGDAASTRERILDVALDLFVRKGYAETSLREIAAELGFTKAALYYHFASKQDILLALHMRVHALTDVVLPLFQAEPGADRSFERIADGLIGPALQNRKLLQLHFRASDAIGDLHRGEVLARHPATEEVEVPILEMLSDPSVPVGQRVRRMASLGAIGGVLLAAGAAADVPDVELERALRDVVHDVLGGRG